MAEEITACWLTLNRACNLKCKWCYAQNAQKESMDFSSIPPLLDFLCSMNIRNLIILGGEPTYSNDLIPLIRACKDRSIRAVMITNGIRLADSSYLSSIIDAGIGTINISQKAYDKSGYESVTGVDCYDHFLHAIENLTESGVNYIVSHVLTSESISQVPNAIETLRRIGAKRFSMGFCYDFEACRSNESHPENPYVLWNEFSKYYEDIHHASEGRFTLSMGLPMCVSDEALVKKMISRNQITSVCQLLRRSGLIFDTDLSVLPCNAMFNYKLGRFGREFVDKESFERFWNSERILAFYNKLRSAPSETCIQCETRTRCGGGCLSNWFNYKFSDLTRLKEESIYV